MEYLKWHKVTQVNENEIVKMTCNHYNEQKWDTWDEATQPHLVAVWHLGQSKATSVSSNKTSGTRQIQLSSELSGVPGSTEYTHVAKSRHLEGG